MERDIRQTPTEVQNVEVTTWEYLGKFSLPEQKTEMTSRSSQTISPISLIIPHSSYNNGKVSTRNTPPTGRIRFKFGKRGHHAADGPPPDRHSFDGFDRPLTGLIVMGSLFILLCVIITVTILIFCKKKNTVFAYQKSEPMEFDSSFEMDDFTTDGNEDSFYHCYYASGVNFAKMAANSGQDGAENDATAMLLPLHYSSPNSNNSNYMASGRPSNHNSTNGSRPGFRFPKSWSCQTNLGRATNFLRSGDPTSRRRATQRRDQQHASFAPGSSPPRMGMSSSRTYHNFQSLPLDSLIQQPTAPPVPPIRRSLSQVIWEAVLRRPWNAAVAVVSRDPPLNQSELTNRNALRIQISQNSRHRFVQLVDSTCDYDRALSPFIMTNSFLHEGQMGVNGKPHNELSRVPFPTIPIGTIASE